MKTPFIIIAMLLALVVCAPAMAEESGEVNHYTWEEPDVPQPYAGQMTIAAPKDLLGGPEWSTATTVQKGEMNPVTDELIDRSIIPAKEDQTRQGTQAGGPVVPSSH